MGSRRLNSDAVRAAGFLGALGLMVLVGRVALLGEEVSGVVEYAGTTGLNAVDQGRMIERYYDALAPPDASAPQNSSATPQALVPVAPLIPPEEPQGAAISSEGPKAVPPPPKEAWLQRLDDSEWLRPRSENEFLFRDLVPNYESTTALGFHLKINRWGMRDRDYEKEKPAGTFRIAILGGSNTMGAGVAYEEVYATLAEERLNEDLSGRAYDAYEILNFAVTAQFLPSRLWMMVHRVEAFAPDLILMVVLPTDRIMVHKVLAKRLSAKPSFEELHFDFLKRIVTESGITSSDFADFDTMARKLRGQGEELLKGALNHAAEFSRRTGIPVMGLVLNLRHGDVRRETQLVGELADTVEQAGLPVLRVFDALRDLGRQETYLSPGVNQHPTPLAHRRLADGLFDEMMDHETVRRMLLNEPPDQ